jgi:hypothetical protein
VLSGLWLPEQYQIVAVALGYISAIALLVRLLRRRFAALASKAKGEANTHLPPIGQLLYGSLLYVWYGLASVAYILLGQIGGWIGPLAPGWTRAEATAALNAVHVLGLVTLVLSQGLSEFALHSFWRAVRAIQQRIMIGQQATINAEVWQFLTRYRWCCSARRSSRSRWRSRRWCSGSGSICTIRSARWYRGCWA